MRTLPYILILFLTAEVASAQYYVNRVVDMFDAEERGIWVRQYEGLAGDVSSTALVLGFTQKLYKGLLMENGLPEYQVEGEVNAQQLHLLVLNDDEVVVGYLQGEITDSTVIAQWNNTNNGKQTQLVLHDVLHVTHDVDCSTNKWTHTYVGRFLDDRIRMILQREESGSIYGLAHLDDRDVSYVIHGICEDHQCHRAQMVMKNHRERVLAQAEIEFQPDGSIHMVMEDNQVFLLEKEEQLAMVCGSQIVNGVQLNYLFPEFKSKELDRWLRTQVNKWLKDFEKVRSSHWEDMREYHLWVDVELLGQDMISGLINREDKDGRVRREAFIYEKGEADPLDFDRWVKDVDVFGRFLKGAVDAEKKRVLEKEDQQSKLWYEQQDFSLKTLRKEGLCLHSDFDKKYGDRVIIVPWDVINTYLKRPGRIRKKLN